MWLACEGPGMLERLRSVLRTDVNARGFAECRRCGTRLDWSARSCPECESHEVARYEL
jgi:hypothetical protein